MNTITPEYTENLTVPLLEGSESTFAPLGQRATKPPGTLVGCAAPDRPFREGGEVVGRSFCNQFDDWRELVQMRLLGRHPETVGAGE